MHRCSVCSSRNSGRPKIYFPPPPPSSSSSTMMNEHNHILLNENNPPLPPEVYYKITDYLDLLTLTSFRLVSHMFRDLATTTIQKRDRQCINISYRESTQEFVACRHKKDSNNNNKNYQGSSISSRSKKQKNTTIEITLNELTNLMENSLKFPINGFTLNRLQVLTNLDLIRFFNKFGHLIKNLKLTFYFGHHSLLTDIPRLLHLTQNLERLELWNVDGHLDDDVIQIFDNRGGGIGILQNHQDEIEILENHDDEIQIVPPPPLQLLSLKHVSLLRYNDYVKVVTKILTSAPNLQTCHQMDYGGLTSNFIDLLIQTGKVHTLHQIRLTSTTDLDLFERLMTLQNAQPKLTTFTINFSTPQRTPENNNTVVWQRLSSVISKFLHGSQNCLDTLVLESPMGHLWKIVFPRMVKCKKLFIEFSNLQKQEEEQGPAGLSPLILPPGLDWQFVFPILNHVTLDFWYLDQLNERRGKSEKYKQLPITGTSHSVKSLEVQCRNYHAETPYPVPWFEEMPRLFPNLQKLDIKVAPSFLTHIFKIFGRTTGMVRLKSLRLDMATNCQQFSLDGALTGLRSDYCRHIFFNNEPSRDTFAGSRMTIADLGDLEELEIRFGSDQIWTTREELDNLILTKVSVLYGFRMMRQLPRIKIVVHLEPQQSLDVVERALVSIGPYANIRIVPPSP